MAFFVQILFGLDGAVTGKGTTDYADINAAEQAYHTAIASAIGKPEVGKIIAMVFDANGTIRHRRVWERNPAAESME